MWFRRLIEKFETVSTVRLSQLGLSKGTNFAESSSRYSGTASTLKSFKLPTLIILNWVPILSWWSRPLNLREGGLPSVLLDSKNISTVSTSAESSTLKKLARFYSTFRILRTQSWNRESWNRSWPPNKLSQATRSCLLPLPSDKLESKQWRGLWWALGLTTSQWSRWRAFSRTGRRGCSPVRTVAARRRAMYSTRLRERMSPWPTSYTATTALTGGNADWLS